MYAIAALKINEILREGLRGIKVFLSVDCNSSSAFVAL